MERLRRTMMFIPGNNPGMVKDAYIYGCDSIMFDLEDSVAVTEKDAARSLVYHALTTIDYGDKELVVRVNALDTNEGIADLEAMVRAGVHVIRLPKTETASDVVFCDEQLTRIEGEIGKPIGSTAMMAAIESASGVLNAAAIACASKRLIGIALGAEDYVTNLKTNRSAEGIELLFARSMILHAARVAGIAALDTVYSDVNNEEGFRAEVTLIKQLGFDGKSIINPRQIAPVVELYTPTAKEIEKALAIMQAIEEANRKGSGVISLNGKMIDRPIVLRAQRVLDLARAAKVLK
ncbi:citrate (pro-3S)-lyase subunit beta [Sphaerochaeta sp.]|uniref:Citrate lyase subunit beta n=1 Tax=bioreactor metagenome TaxID=1076179 RepID=A0A645EJD8_9ZZZZ|nr:citrate (pro-3S)-lyase subunit beta [Sphaerochaeta sp.]MDD3424305.1 citrate (pro-3S)-lyase subunit beta [Sphaerochaeta sp.]MDD3456215.1 citrate (pro-3S)-lyase subunit beta [Sphaerochaeta sp.]